MRVQKLGGLLLVLVLLLAACGPSAELIETPAADMNLTAEEMGSDYTLMDDQGTDAVTADMDPDEAEDARSASLRTYGPPNGTGLVMSMVVNFDSVSAAKANMRGALEGFEEGFKQSLPDATFAEVDAPDIGEDAVMTLSSLEELGFNVYMLAFRENNVMGVIAIASTEDFATEEQTVDLAKKLAIKVK